MSQPSSDGSRLSLPDLMAYFRAGAKPASEWRVGTEYEKFLNRKSTGMPLPYEGNDGIGAILSFLSEEHNWKSVFEGATRIGLQKDMASISLEPGGQFELSGAPFASIHETQRELGQHLTDLDAIQVHFPEVEPLWTGFHPIAKQDDVSWMPKGRYVIMRNYLPTRGTLGTTMMKRTCTVQANLDYGSETDAGRKIRLSTLLGPFVTALFASSSVVEGQQSGWKSFRQHVWSDVDPDRCGNPKIFVEGGDETIFTRYMEWALDVPLFFRYHQGIYERSTELTFREFMNEGWNGAFPHLSDWELHLSTLFPNVRLKQYIEVRSADCVIPPLIPALPAFWKGILYSEESLSVLENILGGIDAEEVDHWYDIASRHGLDASCSKGSFRELSAAFLELAKAGLEQFPLLSTDGHDESVYLQPLFQRLLES